MRTFQFRLQTLLDLSQQRERSMQQELARVQAAEEGARKQYKAALDIWKEWESRVRDKQRGPLDTCKLNELLLSLDVAQKRAIAARTALQQAGSVTERVRARLREASVERKSLETLRERQHEEHASVSQTHEIRTSDDMATVRAAIRCGQNDDNAISGVST